MTLEGPSGQERTYVQVTELAQLDMLLCLELALHKLIHVAKGSVQDQQEFAQIYLKKVLQPFEIEITFFFLNLKMRSKMRNSG